jgi:nicotinamidase-related amidase
MLQKLFRANPFSLPFDEQTSALVIIDMQRDFVEPGDLVRHWETTSPWCAARLSQAGRC